MRIEDVKIDYLISKDGRRWNLINRRDRAESKEIDMVFEAEDGQTIVTRGTPAVYTSNKEMREYLLKALEGRIEADKE